MVVWFKIKCFLSVQLIEMEENCFPTVTDLEEWFDQTVWYKWITQVLQYELAYNQLLTPSYSKYFSTALENKLHTYMHYY